MPIKVEFVIGGGQAMPITANNDTRNGTVVTDTAGANFTSLDTYQMREATQPQPVAATIGILAIVHTDGSYERLR